MLLAATATPQVAEQICGSSEIARPDHIQPGFPSQSGPGGAPCRTDERDQYLLDQLAAGLPSPHVYVTLQRLPRQWRLCRNKLKAQAYHAGLKDQAAIRCKRPSWRVRPISWLHHRLRDGHRQGRHPRHLLQPAQVPGKLYAGNWPGRARRGAHCRLLANPDDLTVLENFTYGIPRTVGRWPP